MNASGSAIDSSPRTAPSVRILGPIVLALLAIAIVPGLASAAVPSHPFRENLGQSTTPPTFSSPQGMAVDQATGDLLVINKGAGTLERFHADGTPAEFPAQGSNAISGFTFASTTRSEVAVDNSGGATDGNIYVAQGESTAVKVYSRNGVPLGELSESSEGAFGEACGVAVGPAGDLYVGDSVAGKVHKYVPAGATPAKADNTLNIEAPGVCLLAAGAGPSAGSLFAAQLTKVTKFDATSGAEDYDVVSGPIIEALGADPATGHVYAGILSFFPSSVTAIAEYNASGPSAATEVSRTVLASFPSGVAVDWASGDMYTTRFFSSGVEVWEAGPNLAPSVKTEAASEVTAVAATLKGKVNPNEFAVSDCRFEYVTEAEFQANGFTGAPTAPCVPDPGSGTSDIAVSAELSGLSAATTYQFRLRATSVNGTGDGSKLSFTTKPAVKDLETQAATNVAAYSASLHGTLDPDGILVTDCHFEYVTHQAFEATGFTDLSSGGGKACEPDPGSGSGAVAVAAGVSSLHPDTEYDFRLLATNANGTTDGSKLSFATDPIAFTDPADTIHHTSVVLHGHLDPAGDEVTNCEFEWGTDTSYSGGSLPCAQGDSFSAPAQVSATLGGLSPGTTYHFRLALSTSAHGNSAGHDQSATPTLFPVSPPEEIASFGPDGTEGSSFGTFSPETIAFDSGNERLFVNDGSVPGVYGFDTSMSPAFAPLGAFNPLPTAGGGFFPVLAVDNSGTGSSGNLYYSGRETNVVYGFDSTGAPLGGNFPIDTETNPGGVVGSPHSPGGLAVDSSGGLWVSDSATKRILHYSSSGVFLNSIDTSSLSSSQSPFAIAFDSNNNLYVDIGLGSAIWKLTAASGYSTASAVKLVSGVVAVFYISVDPTSGNLFISRNEPERPVKVYDNSGQLLYEFGGGISGATFGGIAVDPATHYIYVGDYGNHKVRVFTPGMVAHPPTVTADNASAVTDTSATLNAKVDPEGFEVTDCHFEFGTDISYGEDLPCEPGPGSGSGDVAVHADVSGLNGGNTYHFRVVVENDEGVSAQGEDRNFTTTGPRISSQTVEAVGKNEATVGARINPTGEATTYRVEYGTTSAYGQSTPQSVPFGAPGDNSPHAVSVHIGGLSPGTAYHFRFVAENVGGTSKGADEAFATYPEGASGFAPCPNDQFRTGFGAALPDCRAYEQATPVEKHGANAQGDWETVQASASGDRIDFSQLGGLPTSGGSSVFAPFLASRGPSGWHSDGLLPPTEAGGKAQVIGWSEDMSSSISTGPMPGGADKIFLRDSDSAAFSPSGPNAAEPNFAAEPVSLAAYAADTDHLIFEKAGSTPLAPGAIAGKDNLYDLDHGALTLDGRIPTGESASCDDKAGPACQPAPEGSFAGPYGWQTLFSGGQEGNLDIGGAAGHYYTQNTISRDGSKVFFTTAGTGRLYMREDGARTTWISASQRSTPDPDGHKPAAFLAATPDGSEVFFTSCEKLTDDSTAVSTAANSCTEREGGAARSYLQGSDLYAYDTATGELSDLTVDSEPGDPKGARVQGILGISEDGAYVYFAAAGALAPGASSTSCGRDNNANATCNLYLYHEGSTGFIAALHTSSELFNDSEDWRAGFFGGSPFPTPRSARVSADGSAVLFSSTRSLTGYENAGKPELYRYSAPDEELSCVSCNPTGLPPSSEARMYSRHGAEVPVLLGITFLSRNLSTDGKKAFFESADPLLPSDVNATTDVYEWEAEGSGSCESESQNGGCLYLLSSGRSPDPSYFADASRDGDHVFIFTTQQLVPSDGDELVDIYDAGVGAGLAAQHTLTPPTCSSAACQANPAPPPAPSVASSSFRGAGNVTPAARKKARRCPTGKSRVKRRGKVRCVPKRHAKRHHRRANVNRGGSK